MGGKQHEFACILEMFIKQELQYLAFVSYGQYLEKLEKLLKEA